VLCATSYALASDRAVAIRAKSLAALENAGSSGWRIQKGRRIPNRAHASDGWEL